MNRLPVEVLNQISDTLHGDISHWKKQFSCVLEQKQIHNPEMLVYTCFCGNNNQFNSYRRWKELFIDIANLTEYIETSKFKEQLIHDVLEILFNMNHPLYDEIECELSRI